MSAVDQSSPSDQVSQGTTGSVPPKGTLLGGRYMVQGRLAEGTFGHTYLAKDAHLPHCPNCVVKQLKPQTSERSMQMARRMFETEARVLYDLGSHEQIPQILAHFEQDGEFFLVQEYIDGHAIANEMSPQHPWPEQRVVPLLEEVLKVLQFVHAKQVIHRDLKPGNLLRRRHDNKIVLIDFGAVKEVTTRFLTPKPGNTDYTIAIGTVGYIPKEQLGGRPRFSSDIYAVGMLAIQALTGVHPNSLEEDSETAELRWKELLIGAIHPDLEEMINQMVCYDFRDRYTDAEEALRAIQTLPEALRHPTPLAWNAHYPHVDLGTLPPTQTYDEPTLASSVPPLSTQAPIEPALVSSAPASPGSVSDSNGSGDAETDEMPKQEGSAAVAPPPTMPAVKTAAQPLTQTKVGQTNAQSSAWLLSQPVAGRPKTKPQRSQSSRSRSRRPGSGITTVETTQSWISRSWKLLVLTGSMSLGLLVARGMMLSASGRSPSLQTLSMLHEPLLPGANRMVQNIQPEPEPVPAALQATQLLVEGDEARAQQRYDIALERYQGALLLNRDLTEAHWGKCVTYTAQKQIEAAMEACHDAVATNPNHAPSWWSLSMAATEIGSSTEANKARERALELNPNVAEDVRMRLAQGTSSPPDPAAGAPEPSEESTPE